jgi:hypothetical protein
MRDELLKNMLARTGVMVCMGANRVGFARDGNGVPQLVLGSGNQAFVYALTKPVMVEMAAHLDRLIQQADQPTLLVPPGVSLD